MMRIQTRTRTIGLALGGVAFLLAIAAAQGGDYTDREASKHVGETITVRGVVADVFTSDKGNTFLNFGRRYPNHTFTAVVFRN